MIKLRLCKDRDSKFIMDLANENREISLSKHIITEDEHKTWFKEHSKDIQIIEHNTRAVGYLRKNKHGFISIVIEKEYQNKGIGKYVLSDASGKALVFLMNPRSINAFLKAGFCVQGLYLYKK